MIYVITNNSEPYSYHTDQGEADAYLKDLRRVYPQEEWEFEPITTGRLRGQDKMIWGAECVVDLIDRSIHQWMKVYLWEGIQFKPPQLNENIYRYYPMTFEFTNESDATRVINSRLAGMQFEERPNDQVVRVK